MERSSSCNNRKRAREGDGIEEDHPPSSVAKIKPDLLITDYYTDHHEFAAMEKQHSFDSIFDGTTDSGKLAYADGEEGLFDFPWLKEGMIFKAEDDEEFDFDNVFASSYSSSTPDEAFDSNAEEQNLCQFPKLPNFEDDEKKKITSNNYDDGVQLPSFKADQLEGADWICSTVFD